MGWCWGVLAGARDAGNEKWNDPKKNHPRESPGSFPDSLLSTSKVWGLGGLGGLGGHGVKFGERSLWGTPKNQRGIGRWKGGGGREPGFVEHHGIFAFI